MTRVVKETTILIVYLHIQTFQHGAIKFMAVSIVIS